MIMKNKSACNQELSKMFFAGNFVDRNVKRNFLGVHNAKSSCDRNKIK